MTVVGFEGSGKPLGFSDELKGAAEHVKASTASLGKFQPNLAKKLEQGAKTKGKKRKFESNTGDANTEKERNLGILSSITNKQAKLDLNLAVSKHVSNEDGEKAAGDRQKKGKGKGGKRGGKSKGKGKFSGKHGPPPKKAGKKTSVGGGKAKRAK